MPGIQWTGQIGLSVVRSPSCFFSFFSLSFVLKFNPWMGQEGECTKRWFRLDGPVTSRDKVVCLARGGTHVRSRCGFVSLLSLPPSFPHPLPLSLSASLFISLYFGVFPSPRLPRLFLACRMSLEGSTSSANRDRTIKPTPSKSVFGTPFSNPNTLYRPRQKDEKRLFKF